MKKKGKKKEDSGPSLCVEATPAEPVLWGTGIDHLLLEPRETGVKAVDLPEADPPMNLAGQLNPECYVGNA